MNPYPRQLAGSYEPSFFIELNNSLYKGERILKEYPVNKIISNIVIF